MFRARRIVAVTLLALAVLSPAGRPSVRAQSDALSVRITSPLGRTGLPGLIRIVAQVYHPPSAPPGEVRFYVDDHLLRSVDQGPPYAVEWADENPFQRREIAVEAVDAAGNAVRDKIVLEPFEVTEAAEVTSVLLETSSRRLDFVQRTAKTLSSYMTPLDRMVIAPFSKELGAITGPTNDQATIAESIQAIRPQGGTAILDSLAHAARILSAADGRRAIVLITDGYDEHSTTTFEGALTAVKSAGATLYVVGVGGVAGISIKGERLLRRLAVETGGRVFFPARDEQLVEVDRVLTDDVQNRYLITYTPRNQKIDGTWRVVTVKTADPGHVIRTRPGYFAPKPAPIKPALEFTAIHPSGQYMDLTVEDLEVVENGVPQQVDTFHEAVQPVSIVLALDASGSMRQKEADVVASARDFITALRPQDQLAVVLFSDHSTFAHDLSENRQFAIDALSKYRATGGTALYDALSDSLVRLKRADGRRVVVVMTDGRDEDNAGTGPGSVRRLEDVEKYIKDTGASVFGIGLGAKVDEGPLQRFADLSGGRAFFPSDVAALPTEYRRVVDDLRRRYVVGYTSSHIQRDGSWREVTIKVRSRQDATIKSAGGYFAPSR
ncbi:MAG: VWA domain-containing protein [Acidobacteria bacterium]|nr:VWA domain-containing protein [Acidobacteriota bacterium]